MSEATVVDVADHIEAQGHGGFVLRFILLAGCMTFFDGYNLNAIALVAPSLIGQWHIDRAAFATVLVAGLIGMLLGCVAVGFLNDRYGRKPTAIACVAAYGIFSLLTLAATNVSEAAVLRFATGLGIGGILPVIFTMCVEFVPKRLRATTVTLVMAAFNIGAMTSVTVAALLIPRFGWTAIYWIAGVAPLGVVALMVAALPESARFLVSRNRPPHQIARALRAMAPARAVPDRARFVDGSNSLPGIHGAGPLIGTLFQGRLRLVTPLLWACFFLVGFVLFSVLSWTPTLAEAQGVSPVYAALALTAFSLGTMTAGLASMRLLDLHGAVILPIFPLFACPVFILLWLLNPSGLSFAALLFGVGLGIGGGFNALNALSGTFYANYNRGLGVGWAVSMSRVGGLAGPACVGFFLAHGVSGDGIFVAAVVPTLLFAASAFGLAWSHQNAERDERDAILGRTLSERDRGQPNLSQTADSSLAFMGSRQR